MHAKCVAPTIKLFQADHCSCIQSCSERIPRATLIQYGNYKDAQQIIRKSFKNFETMSAAVIYLPEDSEVTHQEVADYSKFIYVILKLPPIFCIFGFLKMF